MEDLTDVYNDLIMEHSMNSYNKKKLENADYSEIGHNPNCGDEITLELKLNGDKIEDMAFSGHGCAISQASTSIMIDTLRGKKIEEAKEFLLQGHHSHTSLIQKEAAGEKLEFSLIIMHAEDQLISAETIKDLAIEIIEMHEDLSSK